MAWKDSQDFRNDYPNGYSKNGDVYDGNDNRIGYVTGDGDYKSNLHKNPPFGLFFFIVYIIHYNKND